tara:strand:+ start:1928 stop:3112 length:1185 start_codon:yes stop_codon:yes gene_type:complete
LNKTDIIILAGGRGTRIKNYLNKKPKPLIKINNFIFLDLLIKKICKYNFNKLYILAGYRGSQIKKKYHKKSFNFVRTEVIIEKKALGTAGSLSQLHNKINNEFIVINGDTFFDIDLSEVINFKLKKNEIFLSLVKNHNYKSNKKLTFLKINKYNQISYNQKSILINGGIYKFNKFFLKRIKRKNYSLENDIIPKLIETKKVKGIVFDDFFIDIGTPKNLHIAKKNLVNYLTRPALFLDRDNTIINDKGYIHNINELKIKKSFINTLRYINKKYIYIFIVTNQSGIGRGIFTEKQFFKFQLELKKRLSSLNIFVDDVQFCPFHEEAKLKIYRKKTNLRKPGNGMLLNLFQNWSLIKKKSIMIGDQISDEICANKTGVKFMNINNINLKKLNKILN